MCSIELGPSLGLLDVGGDLGLLDVARGHARVVVDHLGVGGGHGRHGGRQRGDELKGEEVSYFGKFFGFFYPLVHIRHYKIHETTVTWSPFWGSPPHSLRTSPS